jgi:hypothetical protein
LIKGEKKPFTAAISYYAYENAKKLADTLVAEITAFFKDDQAQYKAYIDGLGLELIPA